MSEFEDRGRAAAAARQALKRANKDARDKETRLRASNGPSSTPAPWYEPTVKALPPPPERDPDE